MFLRRAVEVAVGGKKQGITKKVAHTSAGRLLICKRELLQQFVNVALSMPDPTINLPAVLKLCDVTGDITEIEQHLVQMPYKQLKNLSQDYKQAWNTVRAVCFPSWITKCDSLLCFSLAR
jgi:tRNA-specific adenosine deaminase 1